MTSETTYTDPTPPPEPEPEEHEGEGEETPTIPPGLTPNQMIAVAQGLPIAGVQPAKGPTPNEMIAAGPQPPEPSEPEPKEED